MFQVGDKVVYPMYGAGIIEAIEEHEVLGETEMYYVIHLPFGDLRMMIPVERAEDTRLRDVVDPAGVQRVLTILEGDRSKIVKNWNTRFRLNMEKLKSGSPYKVAEVVRDLSAREQNEGLSGREQKCLDQARKILGSELILATGYTEERVKTLLDQTLGVEQLDQ
ncbi:MAG: CarD family transcriptional regulator [Limnochordia bacterium]|jgi:CarD family transcriptional regulator|nr:CarD family transcriptional regulator [Limnochordia bacterium]MDD2629175.1 CarD family transcriptional regulator [Limnochordia bacterium]MDD4517327.1 CarD family transcriptional regulator [Limnochordia bacterium]